MIYPNDLKFCNNGDLVVSNVFIKGKFYDAVIQGAPKAGEETAYHIDQIARIKECVQEVYAGEGKKGRLTVSFSLFCKEKYTRIAATGRRYIQSNPTILQSLQKIDNILTTQQVMGMQLQDNGESIFLSAQPYVPKEKPPAGGVDSSSDSKPSRGATTRNPPPHSRDGKGEGTAENQSPQEIPPPAPIPEQVAPTLQKEPLADLDEIPYEESGITLRQLEKYAWGGAKGAADSELDKLYKSYLKLLKKPDDEDETKTLEWFRKLYKKKYQESKHVAENLRARRVATVVAGFIDVEEQTSEALVKELIKTEI